MNEQLQHNPFHIAVVRTDLTRAVASLVPEVLDETTLAMAETFKPTADSSTQCFTLLSLLTDT
jgi:hypothetical protein